MAEGAKVESIDALKAFKRALFKFAEGASVALGDAESEIHRAQLWLETEQRSHWTNQVRIRTELVARAKEAVRMKKLYKDASGSKQSAVEEEKALARAQKRLTEAEQKVMAVRRYAGQLQKDYHVYKGAAQRFTTVVEVDVPNACHKLDAMIGSLESYVSAAPEVQSSTADSTGAAAMTRGDVDSPDAPARISPSPATPGEGRDEGLAPR
jgi:ribosome assembly protein YihI (activator of Der GTPase)